MSFESLAELISKDVYGLDKTEKAKLFGKAMHEVCSFHYDHCEPYRKLCDKRAWSPQSQTGIDKIPYLPTSLFKHELLLSADEKNIFRTISSSATSTGISSRVGLDKETSARQSKCFMKVAINRLGNKRRRFIVLDLEESLGRTKNVSARSSTIRSLLFCAGKTDTVIKDNDGKLELNVNKLDSLLQEAEACKEEVFIFGFTFILYAYCVKQLLNSGKSYKLNGSKVLHIGGWKKLEAQKVTPKKLIEDCCKVFGVNSKDVVDFYGFTEQSGMLYPTCEEGVRHVPNFGDILVRDPISLEVLPFGKQGLLEFLTPIQTSYPGHSVLTEDVGLILGEDNCACGRKGKTFKVVGRAKQAEVRGCGDIMAEKFA